MDSHSLTLRLAQIETAFRPCPALLAEAQAAHDADKAEREFVSVYRLNTFFNDAMPARHVWEWLKHCNRKAALGRAARRWADRRVGMELDTEHLELSR